MILMHRFYWFLAQATEVELRDLVNELNIMANVGEHPNIVSLIGACTIDGKKMSYWWQNG